MTDLDERITRVLAVHARDTDIQDRLDDITSGARIISWTDTTDDQRPTRSRRVAVVAACLLIVAGGFALTQIDRGAEPAPPATNPDDPRPAGPVDPSGRVFPLMRSLPEGLSHIFASSVTFVKPPTTSVTLGRVEGDRMVDVTTVSAAHITPSSSEHLLVPPDAQTSIGTIGGREVTVYDNAGGRWYRWSNDDDVVVLVQASQDSDAIVRQLTTTIDITGIVAIELGELPGGMEVVAAPEPIVGNHPGLSTDAGPGEPSFDLFPTDMPLMVNTDVVDDYRIVDINGTRGFSATANGGAIVTWPTANGVWLRLSASDTDAPQLADVARNVQLVDEDSWRDEYGTGFTQTVAPTPSTQP